MYSEAIMLQVSISQCIVLFSPGPSVHRNLRLHVPVELHPPSLVNRHISIVAMTNLYGILQFCHTVLMEHGTKLNVFDKI